MLKIEYSNQFKKDYKLMLKRGFKKEKLRELILILINGEQLPEIYKNHTLINGKNYKNLKECHITPDCLLIYKIYKEDNVLSLFRIGSHSDLFK